MWFCTYKPLDSMAFPVVNRTNMRHKINTGKNMIPPFEEIILVGIYIIVVITIVGISISILEKFKII